MLIKLIFVSKFHHHSASRFCYVFTDLETIFKNNGRPTHITHFRSTECDSERVFRAPKASESGI